ncbi:hypothetical protein BT96DRAFT_948642 [Gymnopus androsaceus JB14]|uniref:Uncharacterized protein n=1 Tax=Gymnopus androsaceus JB14 TaxID=1447944 RepID=A0A6A4GP27_9AGAR|nr:hypothetical protein BT96DRAFT_948642 [Gymnopus androsaceus JB14]
MAVVPVHPAAQAMHPGVAQQFVHPHGVTQQPLVYPVYMQYSLSSQDPTGPNHFPNPNQPYYYPPPHVALPAQFADQFASDAQVKLFTLILNTFTSTINNDAALKNCQNWAHWHDAVLQALADVGVIGHICDPPPPGVQLTEYNTLVYHPQLSAVPHPAELEARKIWDRNNVWASSVLTACLHEDAHGFLGPVIKVDGSRWTAREMYRSFHLGCQAALTLQTSFAFKMRYWLLVSSMATFINSFKFGLLDCHNSVGIITLLLGPQFSLDSSNTFPMAIVMALLLISARKLLTSHFPGATLCHEMFDAFAQKLVQAEQLKKSSNASCNNNQSNRQQQPQENGKTC